MDGTKLVGILADGTEWQDADGRTAWPVYEVNTLAELLESQGYHTSLFPAGVGDAADAAINAMADACGISAAELADIRAHRHNIVTSSLGSQRYCTVCGHGGCEDLDDNEPTPAELAEYRRLAAEHDARVKATPEYRALLNATLARMGSPVHVERCQTDGVHAFCSRCLATYAGAHTAPAGAEQWAGQHRCDAAELAELELPTGCPDDCVHCGLRTVATELGRCHEVSGLYACNPAADSWVQTSAEIAGARA